MYIIVFSKKFLDSTNKLDSKLKLKLKERLDLLQESLFNKFLLTKPLTGKLSGFYSFRLGKDYRVIFKLLSQNNIYLIKVGHRKDIYK